MTQNILKQNQNQLKLGVKLLLKEEFEFHTKHTKESLRPALNPTKQPQTSECNKGKSQLTLLMCHLLQ